MKKAMMIGLAVLVAGVTMAADVKQLPSESMGFYGASHYVELAAGAQLAGLTNGETFTETFGVSAGSTIQFVGYVLKMPFTSGLVTNNIMGDATLAFGTENSATAFMAAKQIGTNTTAWYYGGVPSVLTPTDVDTNTATACSVSWGTTYSTATNLMITVTPAAGQNLSWAVRGNAILLLKKFEPYGR